MIVDRDKCIGCTLCKQDCIVSDIEMIDKKAHIRNLTCIKCGHCIAICPVKAVSCDDEEEYSMEEVIPYEKEDFTIDADKLMNFMKFRRSVRLFKKDEIEEEKIEKIIDAGRFTQTSTNMQDVSYTIVKDSIPELRRMTLGTLNAMADKMLGSEETPKHLLKYAHMWKRMYESFVENPDGPDQLFFKAPLLIIVKAQNEIDGNLYFLLIFSSFIHNYILVILASFLGTVLLYSTLGYPITIQEMIFSPSFNPIISPILGFIAAALSKKPLK